MHAIAARLGLSIDRVRNIVRRAKRLTDRTPSPPEAKG
jgi:DNA-binding CsgD family transcriptional regulator